MTKDEALEMAIEALENIAFNYGNLLDGEQDYGLLPSETNEDIIIAYRVKRLCQEALEQQENLNLSCKSVQKRLATQWGYVKAEQQEPAVAELNNEYLNETIIEGLNDQEQEPVAWQWLNSGHFRKKIPKTATPEHWSPLYTHPAKNEASSLRALSDDEIRDLEFEHLDYGIFDEGEYGYECNIHGALEFARAIEAKVRGE